MKKSDVDAGAVELEIDLPLEIIAKLEALASRGAPGMTAGEVAALILERAIQDKFHETIQRLIDVSRLFADHLLDLEFLGDSEGPEILDEAHKLTKHMLQMLGR